MKEAKDTNLSVAPTGYRLWDEEKRKIRIERDMKFKEQNKGFPENKA